MYSQPQTAQTGLKDRAADLLRDSRQQAAQVAQGAWTHAKTKPVSTGLLAVGALAGGVMLMNPALRRLAIANAPLLWRGVKRMQNRRQIADGGPRPAYAVNP